MMKLLNLIIFKMIKDDFTLRHNGPLVEDLDKMLHVIGVTSIDELIDK